MKTQKKKLNGDGTVFYLEKERKQVEAFRKAEDTLLPQGFDYMTLDGLRIEARQKLTAQQRAALFSAATRQHFQMKKQSALIRLQ